MKIAAQLGIALLIIAAGVGGALLLIKTAPEADTGAPETPATLVEVEDAAPITATTQILGYGTVLPAQELTLQSEVSGRITRLSPTLLPGGQVKRGVPLVKIDDRDYGFALAQREAELAARRADLRTEAGRQASARYEMRLRALEPDSPLGRALALREPQKVTAEAALHAAESRVEKARLDLERTTIRAPFNAFVRSESLELGQLVSPSAPLATLVGTDRYWVRVTLSPHQLRWLRIPGISDPQELQSTKRITVNGILEETTGSPAVIRHVQGEEVLLERTGAILQLLGDVEPSSRLGRILVAVDDPLGLKTPGALPLLLGSYVRVELEGRSISNVIPLHPAWLREKETVWIMTPEKTLEIRSVEVALREPTRILIRSGIAPGEQIITSAIVAPVPGMQLTAGDEGNAADPTDHVPPSQKEEEPTPHDSAPSGKESSPQ